MQSRAFDDYQVEWEEPVAMVSCIHRLSDRTMMEQKASPPFPSFPHYYAVHACSATENSSLAL